MDDRREIDRFAAHWSPELLRLALLIERDPVAAAAAVETALGSTGRQRRDGAAEYESVAIARRALVRALVGRVGHRASAVPDGVRAGSRDAGTALVDVLDVLTPVGRAVLALSYRDAATDEQVASVLGCREGIAGRLRAEVDACLTAEDVFRSGDGALSAVLVRQALSTVETKRFEQCPIQTVRTPTERSPAKPWWIAAGTVTSVFLVAVVGIAVTRAFRTPVANPITTATLPAAGPTPDSDAAQTILSDGPVRFRLPATWTFAADPCGSTGADGAHSPQVACLLDAQKRVTEAARISDDSRGWGGTHAKLADEETVVDGHRARRGLQRVQPGGRERIGVLHLIDQHVVITVQGSDPQEINTRLAQIWVVGPQGTETPAAVGGGFAPFGAGS